MSEEKISPKIKALSATALTLAMLLFGSLFYLLAIWVSPFFFPSQDTPFESKASASDSKRINVLLLGIDARPEEYTGRTDSMILASVDPVNKRISVLSIPRDTRVNIPGHGMDKINAAHAYGGVPLAKKAVENLLGIPIDYYVKTDFNGFKSIIDTLGGITIDVEKKMDHYDSDYPELEIHLQKGVQQLDGQKALGYVRFRSDDLGDISRTQRQQKFLVALSKELLQVGNILKLPVLLPQLSKAVETDIPLTKMYTLATVAKDLDNAQIVTHTLPGNFFDLNGASYWYVDPVKARLVAQDILNGKVTSEVVDQTLNVPEVPQNKPILQEPPKAAQNIENKPAETTPPKTTPSQSNTTTSPTTTTAPNQNPTDFGSKPTEQGDTSVNNQPSNPNTGTMPNRDNQGIEIKPRPDKNPNETPPPTVTEPSQRNLTPPASSHRFQRTS